MRELIINIHEINIIVVVCHCWKDLFVFERWTYVGSGQSLVIRLFYPQKLISHFLFLNANAVRICSICSSESLLPHM